MSEAKQLTAVKLTVETVTPLFLGGAEPTQEPELRAASFRGTLRFWWRALIAGVKGDQDLETLRKEETSVFGSTENGSPVIVRVLGQARPQSAPPHQSGVGYLLWSMVRTRRQYLPARTPFTLLLQTRPGVNDHEPLKRALASLWLLTHLGGIGSRARRGGGSVQVTNVQGQLPSGVPDLPVRAQAPQQLHHELANGLKQLRTLVSIGSPMPTISATPNFNVLHPNCCRIVVLNKTWRTWEQALDEVGQAFANFRHERSPEHPAVEQIVSAAAGLGTAPSLPGVERAAFGLPLPFYFRSVQQALERQGMERREAQRKAQAVVQPEREDYDRRASPLLIHVVRLVNGQHTIVMTFFKATLLESGGGLALKQGRRILATAAAPSLSLIDAFLSNTDKSIPLLEVRNW